MVKFIAAPLAAGQVVGLLTAPDIFKWYVTDKVKKPSWVPPAPVFGAVWPPMYGLMGYCSYLVWNTAKGTAAVRAPLQWYGIQLGLNLAWQLIFFKGRKLGAAQVENVALFGSIAYTAKLFGDVNATAGKLMLPYLAWVGFANALNYGVWQNNKSEESRKNA